MMCGKPTRRNVDRRHSVRKTASAQSTHSVSVATMQAATAAAMRTGVAAAESASPALGVSAVDGAVVPPTASVLLLVEFGGGAVDEPPTVGLEDEAGSVDWLLGPPVEVGAPEGAPVVEEPPCVGVEAGTPAGVGAPEGALVVAGTLVGEAGGEVGADVAGTEEGATEPVVTGAGDVVEDESPGTQVLLPSLHVSPSLQQRAMVTPAQHVVPAAQHVPLPVVGLRVWQHVEPASQQDA
jgi:hypothetical protein